MSTAALAVALVVPAAARASTVAEWKMDETQGSVMVDSAGGDNNGVISATGITLGVAGLAGGTAYEFGGSSASVEVAANNAVNLNPGSSNMTLTATVKVADGPMADDSYEVVRKGLVTTAGGNWKMEIKRKSTDFSVGKLHCVFKGVLPDGSKSLASKMAGLDIADGRVHTLECRKTATSVQAVVDGKPYTLTKAAGSISNTSPVMIGSKIVGDDVMQGVVDQVTVDIG